MHLEKNINFFIEFNKNEHTTKKKKKKCSHCWKVHRVCLHRKFYRLSITASYILNISCWKAFCTWRALKCWRNKIGSNHVWVNIGRVNLVHVIIIMPKINKKYRNASWINDELYCDIWRGPLHPRALYNTDKTL